MLAVLRSGVAVAAVVAVVGCGNVESTKADATSGPDAFSCVPGAFVECAGDAAMFCASSGTSETSTPCGGFGCNAAAGRCNVCTLGATQCTDSMNVKACEDGSGYVMKGCTYACNTVRNQCNACAPNAKSCRDALTEQTCTADGSGFAPAMACTYGCNTTSYFQCRQCNPNAGAVQCSPTNPDIRVDCNPEGFYNGSLSCSAVYPGTAPAGCNPNTGKCYHQP